MNLANITQLIEVKDLPGILNSNFTLVQDAINGILGKLDTTNNSLKLVDAIPSLPAGGVGASQLVLLNTTGIVQKIIKVSGITQTVTYTVDVDGVITCSKITTASDVTVGGILQAAGQVRALAGAKITGVLDMTAGIVKGKYERILLVGANTGASAATPIDLANSQAVFFDYTNSGSALGNAGAVKLLTTNLTDGQEFEIYCAGTNTSGMALYNGTSGNEIFAFINPAAGGFTSISNTVLPTFAPSTSPNNQSYMRCKWMNIGSNVFRMVILETKNMTNVS